MQNLYNGIPLIRPPMSQKKVGRVLTGDLINEGFFLQENVWRYFAARPKKVAVITR